MDYYLGIDQGGTKTAAIICGSDGAILGSGTDAGLAGVYFDDSEGLYLKRIAAAAMSACGAAGITLNKVAGACGGMNGADWDFEYPILRERLSRALGIDSVIVLNDCIAAMRGGSANAECAVVCAGSGLNTAVRRADKKEIIFGYYVDQSHQGAGALGAAALRKIMEASVGICGATSLSELILNHTGYESAEKLLIDMTMGRYKPENKSLAPLLIKAFNNGDAEAADIVDNFSRDIAKYITTGMRRLGLSGKPLEVVFSGGVFKGGGVHVADMIYKKIAADEPYVINIDAKYEPVCGAALTLLDMHYNDSIPDSVNTVFDDSAKEFGLLRNL